MIEYCKLQALVTCLVTVFVILGTYLNMENPLFLKLHCDGSSNA